jgi:hypothetical protein
MIAGDNRTNAFPIETIRDRYPAGAASALSAVVGD